MAKFKCLMVVLAVLEIAGLKTATAADDLDFELTTDFLGKYIWRGQNLDDDPVFQPGFSVGHKNLTASVWGNLELTNINGNSGDFTELDYSLAYFASVPGIDWLSYSLGVIYYEFPGTVLPDTTEVYWGLTIDAPLSPSLTVYHDLDEADGSYVALAFSHSVKKIAELCSDSPIAMELAASLGWGSASYNKYYWGADQARMNDLTLSASFPFEVAGWTVVPSLNYVTLLSDDIRDTDAYGTHSDFFYAGIGFVKEF